MIFKKNEKFKHLKMYYYYMLVITPTQEVIQKETDVLFFDFDNGQYSITLENLKKKAKAEGDRYAKQQLKNGTKQN